MLKALRSCSLPRCGAGSNCPCAGERGAKRGRTAMLVHRVVTAAAAEECSVNCACVEDNGVCGNPAGVAGAVRRCAALRPANPVAHREAACREALPLESCRDYAPRGCAAQLVLCCLCGDPTLFYPSPLFTSRGPVCGRNEGAGDVRAAAESAAVPDHGRRTECVECAAQSLRCAYIVWAWGAPLLDSDALLGLCSSPSACDVAHMHFTRGNTPETRNYAHMHRYAPIARRSRSITPGASESPSSSAPADGAVIRAGAGGGGGGGEGGSRGVPDARKLSTHRSRHTAPRG